MSKKHTSSTEAARALWITQRRQAEVRPAACLEPGAGEVVVRSLYSGISRGTESLVFNGAVPASEHARMCCPNQEGDFAFPVKYGYAAVGVVEAGDPALLGRTVFCLHPHQTRFVLPSVMAVPLPANVPPARAVLGANMETALNVVWDAAIAPGDRVAVVGAGVVGLLVGWLAAGMPGTDTTVADTRPGRAPAARALGIDFVEPDTLPNECDVVIHASASEDGLASALDAAGYEGRVVEASWYGDHAPRLALGGAFHSRRLSLVSSQVGAVPPARRARWPARRRLEKALQLLADPRLDVLISGETDFEALPAGYPRILDAPETLCHRVRYGSEQAGDMP